MAAAARVVATLIAQHTRVVRVARAGLRGQLCVVVRAIGILDDGADGRAGCFAVVDAGLDKRPVRLLALGGLLAPGARRAHLAQDKGFVMRRQTETTITTPMPVPCAIH